MADREYLPVRLLDGLGHVLHVYFHARLRRFLVTFLPQAGLQILDLHRLKVFPLARLSELEDFFLVVFWQRVQRP